MYANKDDNALIMLLNVVGVLVAYGMMALSLYMSPDVPLSTKGYWGMGILLLTLSLVNVVRYRFDMKSSDDRIRQIEEARNEKLLAEYVGTPKV